MKIDHKLAKSFNKAVTNPDNINTEGSINWDFVDADVFMDMKPTDSILFDTRADAKAYYDQFDYCAGLFSSGKTKAVFDATPSQYAEAL